jgi:arginyl-tRNA synthetase
MTKRAYLEVERRYPELDETAKHNIATSIGLAAIKYGMLKYDPRQEITFDPDTTLSFSGDSGPYLQYVCVRIQSIIQKAKEQKNKEAIRQWDHEARRGFSQQLAEEERKLLRKLYQLPEIIIKAMLEYKPNYLCAYLFDVAQAYNDFYLACPVLKAEPDVAAARLVLSQATKHVLTNGLVLLGIEIPEKM